MSSQLAAYAVHDDRPRGRAHAEACGAESSFDLDRRRIVNCAAFRRLMHKTQVFVSGEGNDHFRTRLTHTLEVAAQARRLARMLAVNERLAEAIALAHDLGHPPFGHAGEKALAEKMAGHGGFEHNLQSLRVVDHLEHPYPAFRGLNLSFEVREGLVKHQTLYDHPQAAEQDGPSVAALLAVGPSPTLEGQIANLADVLTYTLHDIEDGIGDGLLDAARLSESALWRLAAEPVTTAHPSAPLAAVRRPILDRLGEMLLAEAAEESRRRLAEAGVSSADEVRRRPTPLATWPAATETALAELQGVLRTSVYGDHRVVRMDAKARRLIFDLFDAYVGEPRLLPKRYAQRVPQQGAHRVICDYVAGMTDRFCQQEHRRLFAPFQFG